MDGHGTVSSYHGSSCCGPPRSRTRTRRARSAWPALCLVLFSSVGLCQDNPYIYVRMPLTVPWFLYFVFLGAVLIPFVVMIALAWRNRPGHEPRRKSGQPPVRPPSCG